MAWEQVADFSAKNPQVSEDQSQILAGTAQDDIDGIAVGSFEIIAMHKAVVFHVADDRFDGIAPF